MSTAMRALDVARMAGVEVHQRGERWWALCPLHHEKTPSMCFFPDAKWKCFGCGAYGDATDLYSALFNVSLGEALRIVKGDNWKPRFHKSPFQKPQPRKPTVNDLHSLVMGWKGEKWHDACVQLHVAEAIAAALETAQQTETDTFWDAVRTAAYANDVLNLLEVATPRQLVHIVKEDRRA